MQMLQNETVESKFQQKNKNSKKNKEKNAKRMLRARRAIEEYFEQRRLSSLTGNKYWEAL